LVGAAAVAVAASAVAVATSVAMKDVELHGLDARGKVAKASAGSATTAVAPGFAYVVIAADALAPVALAEAEEATSTRPSRESVHAVELAVACAGVPDAAEPATASAVEPEMALVCSAVDAPVVAPAMGPVVTAAFDRASHFAFPVH